ncbi:TPA: hypothetical protein ACXIDO_004333 [Klebsiella pneumoniae]
MKKVTCDTVQICNGIHCKDCGWPIIHACVNWDSDIFPTAEHLHDHPDDGFADWWGYCSNKSCKNHHGEAWDQAGLSFSEPD